MQVNVLEQQSLAQRAADALSAEIITGRMPPGSRIDLNRFANLWDVSITPLRDAARKLEAVGMVVIKPRRGVFVAHLGAKEISDIFKLRLVLETMAIELATARVPAGEAQSVLARYVRARDTENQARKLKELEKVDSAIHRLGYDYCDNHALKKAMDTIQHLFEWSRNAIVSNFEESYLQTIDEHVAICEAVVSGEPATAAAAMRRHLENSLNRYMNQEHVRLLK